MKLFLFLVFTLFSLSSLAGFEGLNDGSSLKIFNRINCDEGITCTRASKGTLTIAAGVAGDLDGEGSQTITGYLNYQNTLTTESLTAADCMTSHIKSIAGTVEIELPEASTVLGCRYTFVTGTSEGIFVVDPDDADQILVETNAVGDSITNGTAGNTIMLEAISATHWVSIGTVGTWADGD